MRSIHETDWHWFTGTGDRKYTTVEINIPPSHVGAEAKLYGTGEGVGFAAIRSFRERQSDGSDKVHDFGEDYWDWHPAIANFVSSISFATFTGGDDEIGYAVLRIDFWR